MSENPLFGNQYSMGIRENQQFGIACYAKFTFGHALRGSSASCARRAMPRHGKTVGDFAPPLPHDQRLHAGPHITIFSEGQPCPTIPFSLPLGMGWLAQLG